MNSGIQEMIGETLGRYRIVAPIGAGGMGEVYRAHDERLDRDVALKVLPLSLLSREDARKRFRREALALSKLNHPNIATVYDFDSQGHIDFLVMELVEGGSLASRLEGRALTEAEVVSLGVQIANALAEAHDRGIVHRDLKPANIALTPGGQVKVLDFGLATLLRPLTGTSVTESLTETGAIAGTPAYMAPEQLLGEPVDTRTDVFAFGLVLYEMIARRRPFDRGVSARLIDAVLHEAPPTLSSATVHVSPEMERIVLKCLEKDPADRYQSVRDLRVDLRRLAGPARGLAAAPARPPAALRGRLRLAGGAIAVAAVLATAALAFNVGGVRDRLAERQTKAAATVRSLAVLPMTNLSHDAEQEYFADGMTEALTAELAQLSGLKVVSRTSAMQYKGAHKAVPLIAHELQVDAVIEGSVQRSGDKVAITVQLIEAPTDRHLWAHGYERDLRDVLALEREVARAVADELRLQLTPGQQSRLAGGRAVVPEAHEFYLRGRLSLEQWTAEGTRQAREYFREATRLDPGYAQAYAALADTYVFGSVALPQKEALPLARAMADKALSLDASVGEAHAALGQVKFLAEWDWEGAEAEFRKAIDLSPNDGETRHMYSHFLIAMGRLDDSLAQSQRYIQIDPRSPSAHEHLAFHYVMAGEYDRAIEESGRALALDPGATSAREELAEAYVRLGRYDEGVAECEKWLPSHGYSAAQVAALRAAYQTAGWMGFLRKQLALLLHDPPGDAPAPTDIAAIYAELGEMDAAFRWLERGFAVRDEGLVYLKSAVYPPSLRADPRFHPLLHRLRLE